MNSRIAFWASRTASPRQQRGITAIIVTIGMIALLAVTGLALDSGHLLMNKTRIQNAVDAAALTAARSLQTTNGNMVEARSNAETTFNSNLSGELAGQSPTITVSFSENLNPGSFSSSVTDPKFVKVATSSIPLQSFLVRLVGFDSKEVAGIAVAGFAQGANICNLIPVVVCSGNYAGSDSIYGYKKYSPSTYSDDDIITLKVGSGDGPDTDIGTGNFHLLNLPGLQGADDIRYAFAGNPSCATKSQPFQINVAPGNKVGPTVQGINTRFGLYSGPLHSDQALYPPDQANDSSGPNCGSGGSTACPDPISYFDFYANNAISSTNPQYQRRIVGVPIANCTVAASGSNTPDTMQTPVGFGCFLLTEPASQQGGAGNNTDGSGSFKGLFIEDCTPPGSGVTTSSGAEIIVLYKNPDGGDS